TQIMLSGVLGKFQQVSLLITLGLSTPGIGGIKGTEPFARIIFLALNCCWLVLFVTVMVREASTLAKPLNTSILLPFISVSTPLVIRLTTLSLKAIAFGI